MGSLYTLITGVPLFFSGVRVSSPGNNVLQTIQKNNITSLSDALHKAGYDIRYFYSGEKFAGTSDFIKSKQIQGFSNSYFNNYLFRDDRIEDVDLFTELKKTILKKKQDDKPFAYILSTSATHFPAGRLDKKMDSINPIAGVSSLVKAVNNTDYLVGDFIDFLQQEKLLEDTVFYIFPDHKFMGSNSILSKDEMTIPFISEDRSLYVLSNINRDIFNKYGDLTQIDLPKLILEGAGIKHNVKFLVDFVKGNKIKFIENNMNNISKLNYSAIETANPSILAKAPFSFKATFSINSQKNILSFLDLKKKNKLTLDMKKSNYYIIGTDYSFQEQRIFENPSLKTVFFIEDNSLYIHVKKKDSEVNITFKLGDKTILEKAITDTDMKDAEMNAAETKEINLDLLLRSASSKK